MLHVGGGVGVSHGIHVYKLLLEHRQQEGEAVVQANVEDELMAKRQSRSDGEIYHGLNPKWPPRFICMRCVCSS